MRGTVLTLLRLAGASALLIFGVRLLSESLRKGIGRKIGNFIGMLGSNSFMAFFAGVLLSLLIGSSSAAVSLSVAASGAGVFTLLQSIGAAIGSDLGATISFWISSLRGFNASMLILALLFIGLSLIALCRKKKIKESGEIAISIGIIFLAISVFQMPIFPGFQLPRINGILVSTAAGIGLGLITQSRISALMIILALSYQGLFGKWEGAALSIGINIGASAIALIASLGTERSGRRTAAAFTIYRLTSSILSLILINPLFLLTERIIPDGSVSSFLTVFNTLAIIPGLIVFLPFERKYAALIEKIIPDSRETAEDYTFPSSAEYEDEVRKLSMLSCQMFSEYESFAMCSDMERDVVKLLESEAGYASRMQEELMKAASSLPDTSRSRMVSVISELGGITASILNMAGLAEKRIESQLEFTDMERAEAEMVTAKLGEYIDLTLPDPLSVNYSLVLSKRKDIRATIAAIEESIKENPDDARMQIYILSMLREAKRITESAWNIAETGFRESPL